MLEAEPAAPVDANTRLRLTAAGRRVLDGYEDHVGLNGVDRWIGGVQPDRARRPLALGRGHRVDRAGDR